MDGRRGVVMGSIEVLHQSADRSSGASWPLVTRPRYSFSAQARLLDLRSPLHRLRTVSPNASAVALLVPGYLANI
jgi:hypothetical protein